MEAKLHQIFQLCMDINAQGQHIALFDLGGYANTLSVSIYKANEFNRDGFIWSGRVHVSMNQANEQAVELISMLETFKLNIPCFSL